MKINSNNKSNQKSAFNSNDKCGTIFKVYFNKRLGGKFLMLLLMVFVLSYLLCYSGRNSTEAYSDGQFKALLISQLQMTNEEERLRNVVVTSFDEPDEISETVNESVDAEQVTDEFKVLIEPDYDELKKAYLTFDDGPSVNTDLILDILKEYNVKASFFVVGSDSKLYKDKCERIINEGHVLGMHSFTHDYRALYKSEDAFNADLNSIQNYIYDVSGYTSTIYRFPGGSSNLVSDVNIKNLVDILDRRGINYYDWNVDSGDANGTNIPSESLVNNVFNGIDKLETEEDRNNVMILMHDLPEKSTTVVALPQIIEGLQARGYIIVPIDNTTKLIHHQNVR